MDENGQPINQTMTEDIMSLPQEVSAVVTVRAVGECAMDVVTQWVEDPEHARCTDKYTAVDLDKIEEVLIMVANYKCFQNIFNQACHGFVQNKRQKLRNIVVHKHSESFRNAVGSGVLVVSLP